MASTNKLITNFRSLGEMEFMARMGTILSTVPDHPLLPKGWPEVLPPLASLREDEAEYRDAALAVQQRDLRQKRRRDEVRERLTRNMYRVAVYLELAADGKAELLESTGFELRRESTRGSGSTNAGASGAGGLTAAALAIARQGAPEGFRVGLGPRAGTLLVDANRQRGAVAYEIHCTRGDPMQDEGWQQATIVTSVRNVLVEQQPAGPVWVRLRAVRSDGTRGPWTAPISVIVG
ncbi:MAG: hypothetical protein RIQ60_1128 [Pseudomonadota bacterium]|jgi:hypothetical protein